MLTGHSKTMIALELPPPQNVSALRNAPPLSVARRWVAENRTPTCTCVYLRVCVCVCGIMSVPLVHMCVSVERWLPYDGPRVY